MCYKDVFPFGIVPLLRMDLVHPAQLHQLRYHVVRRRHGRTVAPDGPWTPWLPVGPVAPYSRSLDIAHVVAISYLR